MSKRITIAIVLWVLPLVAAGQTSQCHVRYVSAEHVYLDAGSQQGLAVGGHAQVVRGGQDVAELEVVFVAGNSASCRVVTSTVEIQPGDAVAFTLEAGPSDGPGAPAEAATRARPSVRQRVIESSEAEPGMDVSGSLGLDWDHASEDVDSGLSSDLVSLNVRALARGLGGGRELRARGSLRRLSRQGYAASVPGQEWRNRILEIALVQDDPRQDWNYAIGRVGSRLVAAAGPFDGLRFDHRVGGAVRLGAFGGFAPRWQDLGFATEDRLAGATFQIDGRTARGRVLDLVVAAVGRYRRGDISREYLSITTSWRNASGLSLLQAAEIDLNRAWRREAAGRRLGLSSLALGARWRASRQIALNLGWDDREPVRTWESRALPDSLFRDAGRRGLNAGVNWRPALGVTLDLRGSVRHDDQTSTRTHSWSGRVFLAGLPAPGLDLDVSVRGFDGPYLSGTSPSVGLTRRSRGGVELRAAVGRFRYRGDGGATDRSSSWAEFGADWPLAAGWTLAALMHRDWGGDIAGDRWLLQWRRRL